MEEFIRGIAKGKSSEEIAKAVSIHFEIEFSVSQCKTYKCNHNIVSGLDCRFKKGCKPTNKGKKMSPEVYEKCKATMFQKGHAPANKKPVGEYTHTTDGYLIQKVQEKGTKRQRFKYIHRDVWEKHHGAIPEGKLVTFLDGNRDNCRVDNLVLINNNVAIAKLKVVSRRRKSSKTKNGE